MTAAAPAPGARRDATLRVGAVSFAHAVVDLVSAIIIPIITVLEGRLELDQRQGALVIAVGSIASGVVQPLVALLSDRHDSRRLGTAGLAVAGLAIGAVGFATNFGQLLILQAVGAAGIGAFHPVGASAVGQLSGRRRSVGVSVFFTAGMVGSVAGSAACPAYTSRFGLEALAWVCAPAAAGAIILAWAIHAVPHRSRDAHAAHSALSPRERRARWSAVALLYAGNVVRFSVNMAIVQLVVRWCEAEALARSGAAALDGAVRTQAAALNGPMQAAMQLGMGAAGLGAGLLVPARLERAAVTFLPLVGAAAIGAFPLAPRGAALALIALCGAAFAGVVPLTIAMSQRLLPHRTSLASGLMMGGAWAFAAVGPPAAQRLFEGFGLGTSFWIVGAALALSGLLGIAIPGHALRGSR